MKIKAGNEELEFTSFMKPAAASTEAAAHLTSSMVRFPLGNMLTASLKIGLDDPALFFDTKRQVFFIATINILLDLHAAHIDAERRELQRKAINAAKYKAERIARHGNDADERHKRRVNEIFHTRKADILRKAGALI